MKRADFDRVARVLYPELGVTHPGESAVSDRGDDALHFRMMLPYRVAGFDITVDDLQRMDPEAIVDRFGRQRDAIFRGTLEHMAKYSISIATVVELDKRIADERTKLAAIIATTGPFR